MPGVWLFTWWCPNPSVHLWPLPFPQTLRCCLSKQQRSRVSFRNLPPNHVWGAQLWKFWLILLCRMTFLKPLGSALGPGSGNRWPQPSQQPHCLQGQALHSGFSCCWQNECINRVLRTSGPWYSYPWSLNKWEPESPTGIPPCTSSS